MKRILILDTETTGLPADMNRPYTDVQNWPHMLSVAWRAYEDGFLMDRKIYIVAPREGVVNSPGAMAVNNITPKLQAEKGVPVWRIGGELMAEMLRADLIVAHNVAFDRNIIGAEFARVTIPMPEKECFGMVIISWR